MIGAKAKSFGTHQTVVGQAEDFQPLHEAEVDGIGTCFIGPDRKLYRKTNSLMRLIAPCECLPDEETITRVFLDTVNWTKFPTLDGLKHLFETFLKQYAREVMFIIGMRHERKEGEDEFVYAVPKQEGTTGGITWWDRDMLDKEAGERFADIAEFVGTVHIHPGNSATPSGTDTTNWAKRGQTGLHVIFGRDGSYTIHGSAAGQVVFLCEGKLEDGIPAREVPLDLLGRELKDLMLEPKPVAIQKYQKGKKNRHWRGGGKHFRNSTATHQNFDWEAWERNRYYRDAGFTSTEGGLVFMEDEDDLLPEEEWQAKRDREIERSSRLIFPTDTDPDDEVAMTLEAAGALKMQEHELNTLRIVRHNGQTYMLTKEQYETAVKIGQDWQISIPNATVVQRSVTKVAKKGVGV